MKDEIKPLSLELTEGIKRVFEEQIKVLKFARETLGIPAIYFDDNYELLMEIKHFKFLRKYNLT